MGFFTPFMLWGALAAGIPVAIHLFFRSRYRTVPWAAMKFLLTSVEQTSRRLKVQEYLLLQSRIAMLVFFAIALARPYNVSLFGGLMFVGAALLTAITLTWALAPLWHVASKAINFVVYAVSQIGLLGACCLVWFLFYVFFVGPGTSTLKSRGEGDAVDAVFVIDTSFSMGAQDGKLTRLQRAKDEALKIIGELPPHSTVQIITCSGHEKTLIGPRVPGNLDQARDLIEGLELTHLTTDLALGIVKAQEILTLGHASNKELYVFSDMQKMGFEQQTGTLKTALKEIKEKAIVHFVRCGTSTIKNVSIIGITAQTGLPRPGERVGFAVVVRNTSTETLENLKVTLAVDGDEKNAETQAVPKLKPQENYAVTLNGKLDKAGLRVLTARVSHDQLEGDNRFDQVIFVRNQVNILVVDGNYQEKDADKASSFFLMHALLPVPEKERATYKYNPRVVASRLASSALLKDQDVCILVNCSLPTKGGNPNKELASDFVEALDPFVRKGHGLIIFSGDNVKPKVYNETLGKKLGLLPMPLGASIKSTDHNPFLINRDSFGAGPSAFWIFKNEKNYETFGQIGVWQHIDLDEAGALKLRELEKLKRDRERDNPPKVDPDEPEKKEKADDYDDSPLSVVVRLANNKPLVVTQKIGAGEVMFIATAAHPEGWRDPKTMIPNWSDFAFFAIDYIPFIEVTINHLLNTQTQTYNLVAGQPLSWYPKDKQDNVYNLVHPDGSVVRLGVPEIRDKRHVVTANDLPRAGVYRMTSQPRGSDANDTLPVIDAKTGTPIAVVPDLRESEDLTSLTNREINAQLGFDVIHIIAGDAEGISTGTDRLNREWTVWALLAVLGLVLFEAVFAWWCGKAW